MKTLRRYELLSFFVPLAVQALSQTFTWPLVAGVVTEGPLGTDGYTAYVQGQTAVFVFGTIGQGLISTGMVFVRSLKGYRNFRNVSMFLAVVTIVMQLICAIPPMDGWVFHDLLRMSGEMEHVAKWSFLGTIPMQFIFFVKNMPLVILMNHKRTSLLNYATFGRIALTVVLSQYFKEVGLVGWQWGCVCMTVPLCVETVLLYVVSNPLARALPEETEEPAPTPWKLFRFNIPLSIGGLMLTFSGLMLAILLARDARTAAVLSVHYLLMGIINPLGLTALRTQSVTIAYPPQEYEGHPARSFALKVGVFFSMVGLLLQVPAVRDAYFVRYQSMTQGDAILAARALLVIVLLPLMQALRGHAEGMAAVMRYPSAVMVGQITYIVVLGVLITVLIRVAWVPAYMVGAISILGSITMAWLAVVLGLRVWMRVVPRVPKGV